MLKFTKYFENTVDRDRYLEQIRRAGVLTIKNNEIVSDTDVNQYTYAIYVEFSDIRYTTYEMPTGTDELYAINVEASAFFDSSDGRALRVKVVNGSA